MNNRVILFGGSFDPPHLGHGMMAQSAMEIFGPSGFFIIPCGVQPLKCTASAEPFHRVKMLKLLFKDSSLVQVSEFEIKKSSASYTVDTIKYFKTGYPGKRLYFIMGFDSFAAIDRWKSWKKIPEQSSLIVFARGEKGSGDGIKKTCDSLFGKGKCIYRCFNAKNGVKLQAVKPKGKRVIYFVRDFKSDIASSDVRRNNFNGTMMPAVILDYIKQNRLYGR